MAVVVKMAGTSPELYSCIAPLVMNPEVIKYNHNYPFKTSESFVWFVAFSDEDNHVLGFFPVEYGKICHNQQLLCGRGCKGCVFELIGSRDKRTSN